MRKIAILLISALTFFACTQEPQYTINGEVTGVDQGTVHLQKYEGGEMQTIDSAAIKEGTFVLKGSIEEPQMLFLQVADMQRPLQLFAENVTMTAKVDVEDPAAFTVEGAPLQEQFSQFQERLMEFNTQIRDLYNQYMQANMDGDTAKVKEIEKQYTQVSEDQMAYVEQYVKDNGDSPVAAYVFVSNLMGRMNAEELDSAYNQFDESLAGTKYINTIQERLDVLQKVAVGQPYVDFTMDDPEGNPVSLSDHIGNGYVLLDFWAAWCNPCRHENPTLVANYEKYHDQGFEIFGVSFDRKKEDWLEAIEKDGITWPQVSDLQYWDNAAGKLYGVRSIPHNVLINPEGEIVAKNLRGEALGAKLEEIYGE